MTTDAQRQVERSVVLHLLDPDHVGPWPVDALARAVADSERVEPLVARQALGELQVAQVAWVDGERVQPSPAARKLDALGLIGA